MDAALSRLESLHPTAIELSLGRLGRLLETLGSPHTRLPPVIHVAGTNGKGSVVAMLHAMASAEGRRAHVYTSPHLVRFNERIVVSGVEIGDADLLEALIRVESANAGAPLTFFEATTAAAFLAFSERPADLCVLEVGLGGRFDATNVVSSPACSVVTPVGLDHMEFLGSELIGIAREKAGVFKRGASAVIGPQEPGVRAALVTAAQEADARSIHVWGVDFSAHREGDRVVFETADRVLEFDAVGLLGGHQIENAGVAAMAALQSGLVSEAAIGLGLAHVRWPARLQQVRNNAFLTELFGEWEGELWIDGAHNPHAAQALARALADLDDADPRPLVLVAAMLASKDQTGFFEAFKGLAHTAYFPPMTGVRGPYDPVAVARRATEAGLDVRVTSSLEDALTCAARHTDARGAAARVVVTGSLYFAGEVLALMSGRTRRSTSG